MHTDLYKLLFTFTSFLEEFSLVSRVFFLISDRTVKTLIQLHFLQGPIGQPCSTLFYVEVLQKLQHTHTTLEETENDSGSGLKTKFPFLSSTTNWATWPRSLECIKQASCPSAQCPEHNIRIAFPRFFYLFNHASFAQPRCNLICKVKSMAKEERLYHLPYAMNTSE